MKITAPVNRWTAAGSPGPALDTLSNTPLACVKETTMMHRFLTLAFAGLAAVMMPAAPVAQDTPAAPSAQTVAFVNVNAVPMDSERVLPDWTVVIRDGRVSATGPSSAITTPAGATVINGRGKFLMPGLTEMHGHIPPPTSAPELIESVLFLYVANGVTTVRGMPATRWSHRRCTWPVRRSAGTPRARSTRPSSASVSRRLKAGIC
jgi:hypothetical protein